MEGNGRSNRRPDAEAEFLALVRAEKTAEAYSWLYARQGRLRGYGWLRWGSAACSPAEFEETVQNSTWTAIALCRSEDPEDTYHPEQWREHGGLQCWAFHAGVRRIVDYLGDRNFRRRCNPEFDPPPEADRRGRLDAILEWARTLPEPDRIVLEDDLGHGGLAPSQALAARCGIGVAQLYAVRERVRGLLMEQMEIEPRTAESWFQLAHFVSAESELRALEVEESWHEFSSATEAMNPVPPEEVDPLGAATRTLRSRHLVVRLSTPEDRRAWIEAYARYMPMLRQQVETYFPGLAGNRPYVDELIQNAIVRAWGRIRSYEYRGEGTFRSWLVRLVRNDIANALKSERSKHQRTDPEPEVELDKAADGHRMEENNRAVREAIAALPPDEADSIEFVILQGGSVEDLARERNLTLYKARSLVARAREKLKRMLGE